MISMDPVGLITIAVGLIVFALIANELKMGFAMPAFRPGGAGVPKGAKGGEATAGMAYRSYEGDIAAVDTLTNLTAFGGNAQTIEVPQGATMLNSLDIDMSLDLGAAVVSVRGHAQIRIIGQGFRNSPHDFNGPALSCQGVTSGNAIAQGFKHYDNLGIAVVSGGTFECQGVLIGEDPGDATVAVGFGYVLG